MSVAMFIYPVKGKNKDYYYHKNPREVLDMEDSLVVWSKCVKEVYYVVHFPNDYDGLSDKEIVEKLNQESNLDVTISSRKYGKGYTTEDKEHFVRIIKQPYEWFNNKIR